MLKDKVIVITGASKGIGKGITYNLAKEKAKVVINYHNNKDSALTMQKTILENGGRAIIVKADISKKIEVEYLFKCAYENWGQIDVLVNNAARQTNLDLLEYELDDYTKVVNTNIKGYFLCMQEAYKYMKKRKYGRIINISSVHAKRPTDFDPVYSMTKGGIKMLTREASIEFAQSNISVNIIEPGFIKTDEPKTGGKSDVIKQEYLLEPRLFEFKKEFRMGKVGVPDDVANLVAYMVSDKNELMTGSSVRIDGGNILL